MAQDVTNFDEDVLNTSFKIPVLADFWASWCAPCRVLGPVLEKLADEQSDRWTLAKIDTEAFAELSTQYQIRGIPAVKLFIDGQVVDEFTGALPEAEIRRWLDKAIPSETHKQIELVSELVDAGEIDQAKLLLEDILNKSPTDPAPNGLLARLLAFSDPDRAGTLIEIALASEPAYLALSDSLKTLEMYRTWKLKTQPDGEQGAEDFHRALSALSDNNPNEALEALIELIKVNRYFEDDASRKIGVAIFITLGDQHPLSKKHRRTFDMWLT